MFDKEYYARMFIKTGSYIKVAAEIYEDTGIELSRYAVKDKLRRTVERLKREMDDPDNSSGESQEAEGEEEQKPKMEFTDDGYAIWYGKQRKYCVRVKEEKLQEAFSLYCLGGYNIGQVCLEMNWTRREFFAIKTAFSITKTELPFTPRQLDQHDSNELAEMVRIAKKRYALKKFEKNKYKDIEARIKQMDEAEYWLDTLYAKVNTIQPTVIKASKAKSSTIDLYKVNLADLHCGLEVDNYFGTYNYEVIERHKRTIVQHIVQELPEGARIHLSGLGDFIHGKIHGSTYKYGGWVMEATFNAILFWDDIIASLLAKGFELSVSMVTGSHGSLESSKDNRTEEDNFGNLIYNVVKWHYKDYPVKFIDKLHGINMSLIPVFNYHILDMHGDNMSEQQKKIIDRTLDVHTIIQIDQGHIHHEKSENINGLRIHYNEPICNTDQYAGNKGLSSECGVRIVQYTPEGKGHEWLCRLQ